MTRPPEPPSRAVQAGGLRLHYLEYGGGSPVIVVVPGITTPARALGFLGRELGERGRTLLLDLRGRGLSSRADSYTLSDYADDLEAVVGHLGAARPVLLGHSLGARIVASLAVRRPGLARATVLVDPPLSGPGRAPYPFPLDFYLEQLAAAREGTLTLAQLRAGNPGWSDEQLRARLETLPSCDEQAIVESYRGFHEEDFVGLWERLGAPVLLMRGADSPVVTDSDAAELAAANPRAEIVAIPGAGHMVPWDASAGLLRELWSFLHRIDVEVVSAEVAG